MTPGEFFALYDGYQRRNSDQEEREAKWVAMLMNASGNMQSHVTAEAVLGRPLRKNWDAAKEKNPELAEKDKARRNMNTRET